MRPGFSKENRVEGIEGLATLLKRAGLVFGAEDVADALWLAGQMGGGATGAAAATDSAQPAASSKPKTRVDREPEHDDEPLAPFSLPPRSGDGPGGAEAAKPEGIAIQTPAAPALRVRLDLSRALRPLRRTVASPGQTVFDEEATVERIADQNIWSPVLRPAPDRWLDLALVVEDSPSLVLWKETIREFQTLVERQGAFRQVTTWRLRSNDQADQKGLTLSQHWALEPKNPDPKNSQRGPSLRGGPRQLLDPSGRRMILFLSDCTSVAWHSGALLDWLETWAKQAPIALVQFLPERLWSQTALGRGVPVWLRALEPGVPTAQLKRNYRMPLFEELLAIAEAQQDPQPGSDRKASPKIALPVVTLEAEPLKQWAKGVAGSGEARMTGVVFERSAFERSAFEPADLESPTGSESQPLSSAPTPSAPTPEERVQRFRATASLVAQRLAGLMAAVPVDPMIVDLIRQTLLPQAGPVQVAEVFMGGLMDAEPAPEGLRYDFPSRVRELLLDAVPKSTTERVLDAVSGYISERLGLSTRSFEALLGLDFSGDVEAQGLVVPFARVAVQALRRLGPEYAVFAAQVQTGPKGLPPRQPEEPGDLFPLLQVFKFREAVLSFAKQPEAETAKTVALEAFEFETAFVEIKLGSAAWRKKSNRKFQPVIIRSQKRGRQLREVLAEGVELAMVWVPAGSFVMGSPEDQVNRYENEGPLHRVTFAEPFLMGKYAVTQAQWRVVAEMSPISSDLSPDPSRFKGENRPVERVTWYDAVEFCARLSQHTGNEYRLPSEAEWEYACRAGTTSLFYFGRRLTPDLANYNGRETTDVGSFPANGFGLFDMHGNVWEWCLDGWHENYEGAPTDGSPWLNENQGRKLYVQRGGSWFYDSGDCRSAQRFGYVPSDDYYGIGFRVVCVGTSAV